MKKRINITIEESLHNKASRRHKNFSKYVEKLITKDLLREPGEKDVYKWGYPDSNEGKVIDEERKENGQERVNFIHTICFDDDRFLDWCNRRFSEGHTFIQYRSYFNNHLSNKYFSSKDLASYVQGLKSGVKQVVLTARCYLNFLEESGTSKEVLEPYRAVLKYKRNRPDVYVPDDSLVLKEFQRLSGRNRILFLVLATSGVRVIEAIDFLKSYSPSKFVMHDGFVSYSLASTHGTKSSNNIYLPDFVYRQLEHAEFRYDVARQKILKEFSLKYLRKWNYNFLLKHSVPESVADFIQGRDGASVAANHYLAKASQANFWYSKVVKDFEELFL